MNQQNVRSDDFELRSVHLHDLSDEQLKARFWELTEQTVKPLVDLARTHTTPSIERSVLLRMGFSSIEAKTIVEKVIDHQLMGKGAGNVVFIRAKLDNINIRTAGLKLIAEDGWDRVIAHFGGKS
ncbi:MAG: ornithine aminomutase subunit alpha [Candidatus Izemoplasmatales bacterium]|jgi:D-ornithine 4,5-aminomutase subunit alpha|nr:ornithine aminomutase subunit alpha [Candidatus Izemoplasmatales bacterium]MDD3865056.1 ornithine aminomutase subunit alpha [Candidatus Izemoplasmatales bacterium]